MNFDSFDCEQNSFKKDEKNDNKKIKDTEVKFDEIVKEKQFKIKKLICICCDIKRDRKTLCTLIQKFKKIDIFKTFSSLNVTSSKNSKKNDSVNSFLKESDNNNNQNNQIIETAIISDSTQMIDISDDAEIKIHFKCAVTVSDTASLKIMNKDHRFNIKALKRNSAVIKISSITKLSILKQFTFKTAKKELVFKLIFKTASSKLTKLKKKMIILNDKLLSSVFRMSTSEAFKKDESVIIIIIFKSIKRKTEKKDKNSVFKKKKD